MSERQGHLLTYYVLTCGVAAERCGEREARGEPKRERSPVLGRCHLAPPPWMAARVAHAQQQLLRV